MKKLFLSADIEGCCGVTAWPETEKGKADDYEIFRRQMSREVAAACEGGWAAGFEEVLVKDAHDSARNILPELLPLYAKINRGWAGDVFSMVSGLPGGFDAMGFVGYHSPAGGDGNPLAHTMNLGVDELWINDQRAAEFHIHAYAAGYLGVPVAFLTGDKALCETARQLVPGITTVAVSEGTGGSSTSIHPEEAVRRIREAAQQALEGDLENCWVELPEWFEVKARFQRHAKAFSASAYPGAMLLDEKTVRFEAQDYFDVLRFFHFVL